jgi:NitT/TauT family transport system substrate-binding protein
VPFYTEGTKEGLFDPKGGGEKAAKSDFEFYTEAGQLEGPASELKVEDYWDLGPLTRAAAKLGG